ncbi:MAG: metalloregulator ArsR/SmtB family transcription factor [Acetobacteraceae bacterium]|nr:metalloregulator ArsR/SmtB family transcription factor [Acetobacteraceae bacterium]
MEQLLLALRAAAEPTRLRLLALAAGGAFCVSEFSETLGQSQPRLSRHLRLLHEAGLLEKLREGVNAWFALPGGEQGRLARELLARIPGDDAVLAADRRHAARVLAERARVASDWFRRQGADWDEMRALDLPAAAVEAALLTLLPAQAVGALLDIGTGTGRLLEVLAPRVDAALGIDASPAMLALARARLARAGLSHCAVRLGDMYRLPFADAAFDVAVLQMVLHHADDPAQVLAEAARVLRPGGMLVVVELARHDRTDIAARLAHRHQGFSDTEMVRMLRQTGLRAAPAVVVRSAPGNVLLSTPENRIAGALEIRLWSAGLSSVASRRAEVRLTPTAV